MYLYHGSNIEVTTINFDLCREKADFGRGFYTTNIKNQAIIWAKRKAIEHMGFEYNPNIKAVVTIFDFDTRVFKDTKISFRRFRGASSAWISFVRNNVRNSNNPKSENNLDLRYDLVIGNVATLDLYSLFERYENGIINGATLKACLKNVDKSNQYSFHTSVSAKYLKLSAYEYFDITKEEFDSYLSTRNCFALKVYFFDGEECLSQKEFTFKIPDEFYVKKT